MRTPIEFGVICLCLLLAGCSRDSPWSAPGNTEWDRAAVLAEVSEPVTELLVAEGAAVQAGQVIIRLDPRRTQAQLAVAQADEQRAGAQLLELRHGARQETIDSARAQLTRATSDADNARREYQRGLQLRKTNVIAQQDLERFDTAARVAEANVGSQRAQLLELLHGTRPEQLAQAEAALAGAQAQVQRWTLILERLEVRAPRAGRIDALPYRLGDQPPAGATLVSMLVGAQPYARVFIPEQRRAELREGQKFKVSVDGVEESIEGVLHSVRSEASFTPYYALNGEDAHRLSYRAELILQGAAAQRLPPGIPCHAEPVAVEDPR
jgi:HlyD family secretion protein